MLARVAQFADILRDSRQQIVQVLKNLPVPLHACF
jgi:ABC-type transporter Mla subunit MlaD